MRFMQLGLWLLIFATLEIVAGVILVEPFWLRCAAFTLMAAAVSLFLGARYNP